MDKYEERAKLIAGNHSVENAPCLEKDIERALRQFAAEAIDSVADEYRELFSSSAELRAQGVVADLDAKAAALRAKNERGEK